MRKLIVVALVLLVVGCKQAPDAVVGNSPQLTTHLLPVGHPKWVEAYDEKDIEVVQTYNISVLRVQLAKALLRIADLEQSVKPTQDPNEVVQKSTEK